MLRSLWLFPLPPSLSSFCSDSCHSGLVCNWFCYPKGTNSALIKSLNFKHCPPIIKACFLFLFFFSFKYVLGHSNTLGPAEVFAGSPRLMGKLSTPPPWMMREKNLASSTGPLGLLWWQLLARWGVLPSSHLVYHKSNKCIETHIFWIWEALLFLMLFRDFLVLAQYHLPEFR